MPRFSSRRERNLWLCSLTVVAAIFASLGLSGALIDALADDTVAAVGFGLALILVALTVVTQGLQSRPRGIELGVGLGLAAVGLMVLLRLTLAERTHLIEYGVLAAFVYAALIERARHGRRVPAPACIAFVAAVLIGVADELCQLVAPNRVFDLEDILFNTLAAAFAVAVGAAGGWLRRRAIGQRGRPGCPVAISAARRGGIRGRPAGAGVRRRGPGPAGRRRAALSGGSPRWRAFLRRPGAACARSPGPC